MGLKKELVSGTIYVAIAKYSGVAMTLLVSMILSRLLTPSDYGVVALATVMLSFFGLLGDIGIGPAVIQNKTLTERDMDSIHTFTAYLGLMLGVVFFLSAPLIANYYDNAEVKTVCRLMSLSIILSCALSVPSNLLYRAQQFKFIAKVSLSLQAFSGIISILMAYYGCGAISLVIPNFLTSVICLFIYKRAVDVHFVLRMDFSPLKRIFSFSIYQFLTNVVSYLSRNVDTMLVGKYIGMKPLGYYNKSFNLMLMPLQHISGVFIPVMLPVFSKYQDDFKFIEERYSKMLRLFAFVGVPTAELLFFAGDEIIILFYGNQWEQSITAFKILAISVPFQVLGYSSGSILQAIGNTKAMFWNGFVGAIITLSGVFVGVIIYGTIDALAICYSAAMIITTFICFFILYHALDSSFRIFLKAMLSPFVFAIALCAVMWFTSLLPVHNRILSLAVKGGVCVTFSMAYIQGFKYYDLMALVKKAINKKKNNKTKC